MAKPEYHPILLDPEESFTCTEWHLRPLGIPWRYLSEHAITTFIHGQGMRRIGDNVEQFHDGDLVLTGPNLSQVFWPLPNKLHASAHQVTVTFKENFMGEHFFELPEMAPIRRLLFLSLRGVTFPHRTCMEAGAKMLALSRLKGWKRIPLLLDILGDLASEPNIRQLSSSGFSPSINELDAGRLTAACRYIHESCSGEIRLKQAATLANLGPEAFSRLFHKKMGRTFETYVAEIRVGQACQLLMEEDFTIADIAFQSGFNSLSNFNHLFRKIKGMTPREFRRVRKKRN